MKSKIFMVGLFLLTVVLTSAYKTDIPNILSVNQRFVKIDDHFYADKYEVSVKDYKFFLFDMKQSGKDVSNFIYDSTMWTNGRLNRMANQDHYFNHHAYVDYPIVAISYDAALEFCNWLTKKYNADSNKKYKKVVFRLPTEKEFIKVAGSGSDTKKTLYPWGNTLMDSKHQKRCNFVMLHQEDISYDGKSFTYNHPVNPFDNDIEAINSYSPNKYGVYNIVGNVSEMIQEKNYAMGGDFLSTGYDVKTTSKKAFKNKNVAVGFRVYMEILEN